MMDGFLINSGLKSEIDAKLALIFSDKALLKSELQDDGSFILIVAELNYDVLAKQVFELFDDSKEFLDSLMPARQLEPRWMLSFHVKGRTLYANIGGLADG